MSFSLLYTKKTCPKPLHETVPATGSRATATQGEVLKFQKTLSFIFLYRVKYEEIH